MRRLRLFLIPVVFVLVFWVGYFEFHVNEYLSLGKLKNFEERICPLISNEALCERMGCVVDLIDIMPVPGQRSWFCEARDFGSK